MEHMLDTWRDGQQLFIRATYNGGYIINYSFKPARVSNWVNFDPMGIKTIPSNVRLIYKRNPDYINAEYVKEFTDDEEIGNIDMEALDYIDAVAWFADLWGTVAEYPPEAQPVEEQPSTELEQQSATE
ncbi:MAG: hypothetical protein ACKPKO_07210, partial [Candidatus Fonsibacter sp.]